MARLAI